jgi:hypothetical protein
MNYPSLPLAFLLGFCTAFSAMADTQTSTLSPLPEFESNGNTTERANTLTIDYAPSGLDLVGKPGERVGWAFHFTWNSNAGDSIIFSSCTLAGDPVSISSTGYVDLIGSLGGNNGGRMLAGTNWPASIPAVPGTNGVGSLVIDEDALPGTVYEGTLHLRLTVFDMSGTDPVRIGSFTVPVAVSVTVVAGELQEQTITLNDIPAKSVTEAPFPIAATSSSRLPVHVTSLTPDVCTIENGIATIHSAGTCMMLATQEGNASYRSAPPVFSSFKVVKLPATVTIQGNMEQNYDGADKTFGAVTAPAGLNVAWLYNGEATPPREPGIYIIQALINDATYAGTAQSRLIITDNRPPLLTNYNAWMEANFTEAEILNGVITGRNQELAGDSLINLTKYAMGFPAKIPASRESLAMLPQIANPEVGGSIIFELPATAPADLTLRVQASSNLTEWEDIARRDAGNPWTGNADVFMGTPTPDGSRIPTLITEPEPVAGSRFYRLHFSPFP